MSKNIGWTKKQAEAIAKKHNASYLAHHAYAIREDLWPVKCHGDFVMQWTVTLQKKPLKNSKPKEK